MTKNLSGELDPDDPFLTMVFIGIMAVIVSWESISKKLTKARPLEVRVATGISWTLDWNTLPEEVKKKMLSCVLALIKS